MDNAELEVLMGGYYHQDFDTVWGALDLYLSESSETQLAQLIGDVEQVLASPWSDAEVRRHLEGLGNCADRSNEPGGYRRWLEEIARRVRAHLAD